MSFVGYTQIDSEAALTTLITEAAGKLAQSDQVLPSYYFLRWAHRVSGIVDQLPDDLSPAGQIFNPVLELRWKKQKHSYAVLLLSQLEQCDERFTPIPGDWETSDRTVHFYDKKDTRFPKGLIYPEHLAIRQRYFFNAKTATVHFVALTVAKS